jgi:hypothetical protein
LALSGLRRALGAIAGLALLVGAASGATIGGASGRGVVEPADALRVTHLGDGIVRWTRLDGRIAAGPVVVEEGILSGERGDPLRILVEAKEGPEGADRVSEGQALLSVRSTLRAEVAAATEAELAALDADLATLEAGGRSGDRAAAESAVSVARARLSEARQIAARLTAVGNAGAIPTWEAEVAALRVSVREAELAEARAGVAAAAAAPLPAELEAARARAASARARLTQARARLDAEVLRAPFAGRLIAGVDPVVLELVSTEADLLRIALPENQRAKVALGDPITFRPVEGGSTVEGRLIGLDPRARSSMHGPVFFAVAQLERPLPLGATGGVSVGAWRPW